MLKLTSPTRKSQSSTGKEGTQQHLINLCNWAVEDCAGVQFTDLQLEKCNIEGCDKVLHHLCQINWQNSKGLSPGGCSKLC